MIDFIRGKLVEKNPAYIVVETNGVGFRLLICLSSFEALGEIGSEIQVLTYLHMREDSIQLFGFATQEERELFQLMISVSGIGPRLAQRILSGISINEFKRAIREQDLLTLVSAPSVGKKTAERLVLELREKIGYEMLGEMAVPQFLASPLEEEATLALVSLGYSRSQVREAIQKALKKEPTIAIEELIRRVLRKL
jgi:Holliday junction DNA helicase RuvA